MNILEIISNNIFLKKLYPEGLFNFFVGRIEITAFRSFTAVLHMKEKPAINVVKWGQWGVNYDVVTIELTGSITKKLNITNWQNNNGEICNCEVSKTTGGFHLLVFSTATWRVEIEAESLIFQRNTTYIS